MGRLDMACNLLSATYFGGASNQKGGRIAACISGDVCISGETDSAGFPATPGAAFPTGGGGRDAFAARLSGDGTALVWASFLGGSADEVPWDMCVDLFGNVYIAGQTASLDYPLAGGPFDTTIETTGTDDGFVARISSGGSALEYSSYLGGSDTDIVAGIFWGASGQILVAGTTLSPDFPTLPGSAQPVFGGGYSDIFVTGFDFCNAVQASAVSMGPGCSTNDPVLTATPPILGGTTTVSVASTLPGRPVGIFYSLRPVLPIIVPPCKVYVDALNAANFYALGLGVLDGSGSYSTTFATSVSPNAYGLQLVCQAAVVDPSGPIVGTFLSNGLLLTLGCP
jgi:hypothetical protein